MNKEIIKAINNYAEQNDITLSYFTNPFFYDAIVGISYDDRVVYDFDKMIDSMMIEENCSYEEAIEWIEFNTLRTLPYIENAPIIIHNANILEDYYE